MRVISTIGYERRHNETLALDDEDAFVEKVLANLAPAPAYYKQMKEVNALRVGYDRVGGYLRQGMRGWTEAGRPFVNLPQMSVQELKQHIESGAPLQVLDVRSQEEWQQGAIPTAQHIYAPDLERRLDRLDPHKPVVTYCGSGYRASIAASILQRNGFDRVFNLPGSMDAWQAAGYSLEFP